MTMDEKELLRQLSERYPPQEESGQQIPDWMMQGGQPAQMPMGMQLLPERPEGAMPGTGLPQSAGADSSLCTREPYVLSLPTRGPYIYSFPPVPYTAALPSCASIRSRRLYFATRSLRQGAPHLI